MRAGGETPPGYSTPHNQQALSFLPITGPRSPASSSFVLARALTGANAAGAAAASQGGGPVAQSSVAFTPGSGQSAVDWNRELITILGTPGGQPATVHPTRSLAILQAAEYDAVTSITHAAQPYLFSVPARGAPGRTPPPTRPRTAR